MKKFLLLALMVFSLNLFSTSRTEGLEKTINSKFSFFMSQQELERMINQKPVLEHNGIIYYEKLPDPIGINRQLVSFVFSQDGIISSVYGDEVDMAGHKENIKKYREYFKNVPHSKLKKVESKDGNTLLYYNDYILLQVAYINGHSLITEQLYTKEMLDYRLSEIK